MVKISHEMNLSAPSLEGDAGIPGNVLFLYLSPSLCHTKMIPMLDIIITYASKLFSPIKDNIFMCLGTLIYLLFRDLTV